MFTPFNKLNKSTCTSCKDKSCAVAVLNESQLELLDGNSYESEIKKGETILRSGALVSHIIYLKTGYVKEFIIGQSGKTQIIQIVKPFSYLGLHSLFGDKINHYSYTALEDLKICYIDISAFKRLIKENGDFAYEVLVYVCKESLNNFFRFANQSQKSANGRFADILLYFSEMYNNCNFNLPLTRQELADLISLSRENTTRVMSRFKADGIIKINDKNIEIVKFDLLKKISKNG
ncbi:MAG: Crp/Fnr family transcriptional regulator [Bacteroidia bacterium]|nr:Crp/Fnr family transcriptional regulator [Bacteroidia bacterium]